MASAEIFFLLLLFMQLLGVGVYVVTLEFTRRRVYCPILLLPYREQ